MQKIDRIELAKLVQPVSMVNVNKIDLTVQGEDIKVSNPAIKDEILKHSSIPNLFITKEEYTAIIKQRNLQKYRPIKNALIKKADKVLLSKSLGIKPQEVNSCIKETYDYLLYINPESIYYDKSKADSDLYDDDILKKSLNLLNIDYSKVTEKEILNYYKENVGIIKPYILRHGTKSQFIKYVQYELSFPETALEKLYRILDRKCHGLYDYYYDRPLHVLDNDSVIKIHEIITDSVNASKDAGFINDDRSKDTINWALNEIYTIQNNPHIRSGVKFLHKEKAIGL